jgi:hypothetical protein
MPWPPATKTRSAAVRPISGRPSGVTGREPTHSSTRRSGRASASIGHTASAISSIRRARSAAPGGRSSMIPAILTLPSGRGVQASRAGGKYNGPRGGRPAGIAKL